MDLHQLELVRSENQVVWNQPEDSNRFGGRVVECGVGAGGPFSLPETGLRRAERPSDWKAGGHLKKASMTMVSEKAHTPGRLEDVKVLLVDDDSDILESMEAAFQTEGALTQSCGDGNEAVAVVQSDPPDLVILDMMLPKRSGFLVLEKIKGIENAPVVIMVTANEGKRHNAYAESLGVDAYLQKPVPLLQLLDKSVELIRNRKKSV